VPGMANLSMGYGGGAQESQGRLRRSKLARTVRAREEPGRRPGGARQEPGRSLASTPGLALPGPPPRRTAGI